MVIKRLVAAMWLAGFSHGVHAETFTVKDIQVEGLQRVALGAALLVAIIVSGAGGSFATKIEPAESLRDL